MPRTERERSRVKIVFPLPNGKTIDLQSQEELDCLELLLDNLRGFNENKSPKVILSTEIGKSNAGKHIIYDLRRKLNHTDSGYEIKNMAPKSKPGEYYITEVPKENADNSTPIHERLREQFREKRKLENQSIALKSFDEQEFGLHISLIVFSNLANNDAANELTKRSAKLLKDSLPQILKLDSLVGDFSKEKADEYLMYLVKSSLTSIQVRLNHDKPLSEMQKKVKSHYDALKQKEEFSNGVLNGIRNHFGIENPNPTSSPVQIFPKDISHFL